MNAGLSCSRNKGELSEMQVLKVRNDNSNFVEKGVSTVSSSYQ